MQDLLASNVLPCQEQSRNTSRVYRDFSYQGKFEIYQKTKKQLMRLPKELSDDNVRYSGNSSIGEKKQHGDKKQK